MIVKLLLILSLSSFPWLSSGFVIPAKSFSRHLRRSTQFKDFNYVTKTEFSLSAISIQNTAVQDIRSKICQLFKAFPRPLFGVFIATIAMAIFLKLFTKLTKKEALLAIEPPINEPRPTLSSSVEVSSEVVAPVVVAEPVPPRELAPEPIVEPAVVPSPPPVSIPKLRWRRNKSDGWSPGAMIKPPAK